MTIFAAPVRRSAPWAVSRALVVKVTAGDEAPERCAQALTVAATAAGAGVAVSLWLTGEASPARAARGGPRRSCSRTALPLADLLGDRAVDGAGDPVHPVRRTPGDHQDDVVGGIRIAGAAAFVEEALAEGAQALVY